VKVNPKELIRAHEASPRDWFCSQSTFSRCLCGIYTLRCCVRSGFGLLFLLVLFSSFLRKIWRTKAVSGASSGAWQEESIKQNNSNK
jgi:hypothetical protein